jgi:hypothetical protein
MSGQSCDYVLQRTEREHKARDGTHFAYWIEAIFGLEKHYSLLGESTEEPCRRGIEEESLVLQEILELHDIRTFSAD